MYIGLISCSRHDDEGTWVDNSEAGFFCAEAELDECNRWVFVEEKSRIRTYWSTN